MRTHGTGTPTRKTLLGVWLVAAAVMLMGLMSAVGCEKPVASSSQAIQHAEALKTPEQRAEYLVRQAKAFMKAKSQQEAIKTLHYVLASVDPRSDAAKNLLAQADAQLAADAHAVVGDTKKQLEL
jgi:hypothetical protein